MTPTTLDLDRDKYFSYADNGVSYGSMRSPNAIQPHVYAYSYNYTYLEQEHKLLYFQTSVKKKYSIFTAGILLLAAHIHIYTSMNTCIFYNTTSRTLFYAGALLDPSVLHTSLQSHILKLKQRSVHIEPPQDTDNTSSVV